MTTLTPYIGAAIPRPLDGGSGASTPIQYTSSEWELPGVGESYFRDDISVSFALREGAREEEEQTRLLGAPSAHQSRAKKLPQPRLLGQLASTALCGNDITSSCLYVAGICAYYSGKWAPFALVLVSVTLYLFRKIYEEAISAIPLNGATYTILLNTSSKTLASFAACLTLLSYVSTAVVSGSEAIHYAKNIFPSMPVDVATVVLLGFFGFLSFLGMKESSPVAVTIFLLHIATLFLLILDCFTVAVSDRFQTLRSNWTTESWPNVPTRTMMESLFYGFGGAMLGISGFETSANFIEEQTPGVFRKTLRNMWVAVTFFNPLLSLLAMSVLPLPTVMGLVPLPLDGRPNNKDLLKMMASSDWLKWWVSLDAALVLSGAVLTSYVGVIGLCKRMALDRCLPDVLLHVNRFTGTLDMIILIFFLICASLYLIVDGNVLILSGIYTMSFLSVMGLFAFGNLLLKYKRSKIRRDVHASVLSILVAFCGVLVGLCANIVLNQKVVKYFFIYYGISMSIVLLMFWRLNLLKICVRVLFPYEDSQLSIPFLPARKYKPFKWLVKRLVEYYRGIKSQKVVYFVKTNDISEMNRAAIYIRDNEQTMWLVYVHVYQQDKCEGYEIKQSVKTLDSIYPKQRFDFVGVRGDFSPDFVHVLSEILDCPKHFMFISCPGFNFKHNIASFGGIRTITH